MTHMAIMGSMQCSRSSADLRRLVAARGFTLIELLVVIAIIGILSSVVLASLNSARQKGRDARRIADVKQLQLALELYYDSENEYPAALSSLSPDFISAIPLDPGTGDSYSYDDEPSGSYHLGTNLESDTHSALDADADDDTTTVDGADSDGCGDEASLYCYDVTP